ncbi:unnamed protein product [Ambrosiozyma monospora]|uniref:Unnamed protein product n=1 Tax=Ambrosiozyma monospora TaxID=43982 RepID=A0ACB5T2U0_AMBMO|nr:unnamed protein product [Ambrosiozyma monospora]
MDPEKIATKDAKFDDSKYLEDLNQAMEDIRDSVGSALESSDDEDIDDESDEFEDEPDHDTDETDESADAPIQGTSSDSLMSKSAAVSKSVNSTTDEDPNGGQRKKPPMA